MTTTTTINDNVQQIKAEGGRRSQKIGQIFQAAFTEVVSEVKDGTTTVRPLIQALADSTVHTVKEKTQEVNTNVRQALKDHPIEESDLMTRIKLQLQLIFNTIKATLVAPSSVDEVTTTTVETGSAANHIVTLDTLAAKVDAA
jgi:hypothetical protein